MLPPAPGPSAYDQPRNDPEAERTESQVLEVGQLEPLIEQNVSRADGQEHEQAEVADERQPSFDLAADRQDDRDDGDDRSRIAVQVGKRFQRKRDQQPDGASQEDTRSLLHLHPHGAPDRQGDERNPRVVESKERRDVDEAESDGHDPERDQNGLPERNVFQLPSSLTRQRPASRRASVNDRAMQWSRRVENRISR